MGVGHLKYGRSRMRGNKFLYEIFAGGWGGGGGGGVSLVGKTLHSRRPL